MPIKSIHIKGYKSLRDITVANPGRVNYFVGKNGCGKSSVMEALTIVSKVIDVQPNHGMNIPGLTKYALSGDLYVNIAFDNDKSFRLEIPQSVEIQVGNGNFGVPGDVIRFWDGSTVTNWPDLVKRDIILKRTQGTITTRYVASFVQQEDSADYVILPEHLFFDFNSIDTVTEDELIAFLNRYYPLKVNEVVSDVSSSIRSDKAAQFTIVDKETKEKIDKIALSQLSSGLRAIARFYFGLNHIVKETPQADGITRVICIEEPENGFHPEIHKIIPKVFNGFLDARTDLMFMVTTHSPFIVSASGKFPEHKTYILERGSLVNLALDPVPANEGYSGDKCINVVADMLGLGFADLGIMPQTYEELTICYCEGNAQRDSELYRRIFQNKSILFVSCGGLGNVRRAYNLARKSAAFLLGEQTKVLGVVDRSCSSNDVRIGPLEKDVLPRTGNGKIIFTDEERDKFIASDPYGGLRMLKRKEIENYLFDPAVVNLLDIKELALVDIKPQVIDYAEGEVKDKVKAPFEIRLKLAELIYRHRDGSTKEIYSELEECLLN
jgi:hypothetical protein